MTTAMDAVALTRPSTEELAALLRRRNENAGVAESLTGGLLTNCLAAGPDASEWLRGGVVAYSVAVKQSLLGVRPGPVVSEQCATDMATGAARVLDADLAIAVTGVGGPGPEEGQPPGTVWVAIAYRGEVATAKLTLEGDTVEVCVLTCRHAVELARDVVRKTSG